MNIEERHSVSNLELLNFQGIMREYLKRKTGNICADDSKEVYSEIRIRRFYKKTIPKFN